MELQAKQDRLIERANEIMQTIIRNADAIVTCNENDDVYFDVDLLIDGNQIGAIGKNLTVNSNDEVQIIDAKGKFIYPGLINTHHHFFQVFVRNLITIDYPRMKVVDWLREIYTIFEKINAEVVYYSSLTAMGDLAKHGCTTVFDHHYCFTQASGPKTIDEQMLAAEQLGLRFHAGRGTNTLPMSEGSTIPDAMLETTDLFISECERLIDRYHDPSPFSMKQIVVAPCQPVNCYKETFVQAAELARDRSVRLHTHLGEGENENMIQRWGKRTLDWCEEIEFAGEDVWYAHGWELLPDEYERMGKLGTGVTYCPAPAIMGGFPVLNIPDMQRKGVVVSLGCDGSSTNDSSNLLESLRLAYLMQTFKNKERSESLTPYEVLKLATVEGALTLGRSDIGSLVPGKAADLFAVDVENFACTGATHDAKNLLAKVGVHDTVWLTIVNGEIVFHNGELKRVNEQQLVREAEEVCDRVLRGPFKSYYYGG